MGILAAIMKGLTNPKIQKYILYALIIIAILYLLSKSSEKVALFFKNLRLPKGENVYSNLGESETARAEEVASSINAYLDAPWYSGIVGNIAAEAKAKMAFQVALGMPDNELYYLTRFYKSSYMKALYKDIEEESMPSSWDVDVKLLQRLEKMNLVG